jgi:hypothetical protein
LFSLSPSLAPLALSLSLSLIPTLTEQVRTAHEEHLLAVAAGRGLRRRARLCLRRLHQDALRQSAGRRLGVAAVLRDAWRRLCTGQCVARDRREGLVRAVAHAHTSRDGAARRTLGAALVAWRDAARRSGGAARSVARGGAWCALRATRRVLTVWAEAGRARRAARLGQSARLTVAARQLESTAAGRALRRWCQAAVQGARQRRALALRRRRACGLALRCWAAAACAHAQVGAAAAAVRRTRAAATFGRAWCRWLGACAQRRVAGALLAQASAAARRREARRCAWHLCGWSTQARAAASARLDLQRAAAHAAVAAPRRALRAWALVLGRHGIRASPSHHAPGCLRVALERLRAAASHRAAAAAASAVGARTSQQRACTMLRANALVAADTSMRREASEAHLRRTISAAALRVWARRALAAASAGAAARDGQRRRVQQALVAWRACSAMRRRLGTIASARAAAAARCALRLDLRRLQRALCRTPPRSVTLDGALTAAAGVGRRLLGSRACVRRWAAAARWRGAARRVQSHRAAADAARALRTWRELCPLPHEQGRLTRLGRGAAARSHRWRRAAAGALVRLRSHAAPHRQRAEVCAAACELTSRRACREGWRRWVGARRRRALGALGLADRHAVARLRLCSAWHDWRVRHFANTALRSACWCLVHFARAAALCAWQRVAARRRGARDLLRAGAAHHAWHQMTRHVSAWLAAAERLRLARRRLGRLESTARGARARRRRAAALRGWSEAAAGARAERGLRAVCRARAARGLLSAALRRWSCAASHRCGGLSAISPSRMDTHPVAPLVCRWRAFSRWRAAAKAGSSRLALSAHLCQRLSESRLPTSTLTLTLNPDPDPDPDPDPNPDANPDPTLNPNPNLGESRLQAALGSWRLRAGQRASDRSLLARVTFSQAHAD